MAILALVKSLYLKQTPLALVFRDFIIREHSQNALELLEKKDYAEAKESLSQLRYLDPHNQFLNPLYRFARHLFVKDMIDRSPQHTISLFNENQST